MEKYIGMDVHATSCTAAVVNAQGKRLGAHVIATSGAALVEFLKTQAGTIHLCIEEGTQSTWLAEILSPHVEQMVVTHVSESRGQKNDERDAFTLAERLRTGRLETSVYKQVGRFGKLRQLVRAHSMIVQDTARVQHRIESLLRSRGVPTSGKSMYATKRAEYLAALPASTRGAAELLFAQYDAVAPVRDRAQRSSSRNRIATRRRVGSRAALASAKSARRRSRRWSSRRNGFARDSNSGRIAVWAS